MVIVITIKVYSSNCPKCNILEKKLQANNIEFEKITDFDTNELIERGFYSLPIANIDEKWYTFQEAIQWLDENY